MTVRYLAVALFALAGTAFVAPPLFADSINLLRPAGKGLSPSILFDASRRPLESDDQAASELDEDCVALNDRTRSSSAHSGAMNWNFGQLMWEEDQRGEPALIYLICVNPARERSSMGGAMQMIAALSWSGAPSSRHNAGTRAPRYSAEPPTAVVDLADLIDIGKAPADGGLPGSVDLSGAFGAPGFTPLPGGDVIWAAQSGADPFPITLSSLAAGDDPPIALDPREWAEPIDMAPVPEPGTWLLMGTGLAAAWRAARRRK